MRPKMHGLSHLSNVTIEKIFTGKVNVETLIKTFEANEHKFVPKDWSHYHSIIAPMYTHMFFRKHLPPDVVANTSHEIFEMATECLGDELIDLIEKPKEITGRSYYYEYARSLAMDEKLPLLQEHIGEDCDFI